MIRVFAGGLSWNTTDESLKAAFAPWGAFHAMVMVDEDSGRSRGFGFVSFGDLRSAQAAANAMDGRNIDGRKVRVNLARPKDAEGAEVESPLDSLGGRFKRLLGSFSPRKGAEPSITVPEPVIILPAGYIGFVLRDSTLGGVSSDGDRSDIGPASMLVDTQFFTERIAVNDMTRWRRLMTRDTALRVERLLAVARPIPGWTRRDGIDRGWVLPEAGPTHDLWAEGLDIGALLDSGVPLSAWGLTAIATLLDWAVEATARREVDGLWLGRLHMWRETLLGELAWVLGVSNAALLGRLVALRLETSPDQLVQLFTSMPAGDTPRATHDWSEFGTVALGEIDCPGRFVVAENGWHIHGMCLPIDEPLHIKAQPGRWSVVASRARPEHVAILQRPDIPEAYVEAWEATSGRSWVVLACEGRLAVAPVTTLLEPDAASLKVLAQQTARWDDDPLTEVTLWAPREDLSPEPLELIGIAEVVGGNLAVLAGDTLTAAKAHGLRQVSRRFGDQVTVWPWAVLHGHRRAAIPVYAGGPPHARTYIAFPAPPG